MNYAKLEQNRCQTMAVASLLAILIMAPAEASNYLAGANEEFELSAWENNCSNEASGAVINVIACTMTFNEGFEWSYCLPGEQNTENDLGHGGCIEAKISSTPILGELKIAFGAFVGPNCFGRAYTGEHGYVCTGIFRSYNYVCVGEYSELVGNAPKCNGVGTGPIVEPPRMAASPLSPFVGGLVRGAVDLSVIPGVPEFPELPDPKPLIGGLVYAKAGYSSVCHSDHGRNCAVNFGGFHGTFANLGTGQGYLQAFCGTGSGADSCSFGIGGSCETSKLVIIPCGGKGFSTVQTISSLGGAAGGSTFTGSEC